MIDSGRLKIEGNSPLKRTDLHYLTLTCEALVTILNSRLQSTIIDARWSKDESTLEEVDLKHEPSVSTRRSDDFHAISHWKITFGDDHENPNLHVHLHEKGSTCCDLNDVASRLSRHWTKLIHVLKATASRPDVATLTTDELVNVVIEAFEAFVPNELAVPAGATEHSQLDEDPIREDVE